MNTILIAESKIITVDEMINIHSIWFWIAILEFIIITVLILLHRKKNKNIIELSELESQTIEESKKVVIDMDNLMDSIHNSRQLYKEMSRKCHPDNFINNPKHKLAEDIFQEITKNEKNYKNLNFLKDRAIKELNINF